MEAAVAQVEAKGLRIEVWALQLRQPYYIKACPWMTQAPHEVPFTLAMSLRMRSLSTEQLCLTASCFNLARVRGSSHLQ